MIKKYLQDAATTTLKSLLGGHSYTDWADKNLILHTNISIKNKTLAKDLEEACEKKGFLTYSQFLTIDQFGKYGYHNTHKQHGMTDVKFRWPEALAALCKEKNLHHIVEFGPGDGVVGVKTLQEAKKLHHPLSWSGIEISKGLRDKATKLFQKKKLSKQLVQLVSTLDELSLKEPCLFVFSYSLDNLIPDVFINTSSALGTANAMVGIKVKDGILSETLLPSPLSPPTEGKHEAQERILHDVFTDQQGFSWDLSSWQLHPMQRLYISLDAYRTLFQVAQLLPKGSQILVIDEFRKNPQTTTYHLGVPRDLETFSRDFTDLEKFYKTAGSNLLYFPMFLDTTIDFLSQIDFDVEENVDEHVLANKLSGRNNPVAKHPNTLALLTESKKKNVLKKNFILKP